MIDIAIILWSTIMNALADRYYPTIRIAFPNWIPAQWRWHLLKWAFFYPPLVRLLYLAGAKPWEWVLLITVCFLLWQFFYKVKA